jgi:hypothetical protein
VKPTLLFVTYGGGHVNALLPVIRSLRQRESVDVQVLGLTTARAPLEAEGIKCLGFRDFLRPSDEAALAHGKSLVCLNKGSTVPENESIAYLGLSYADLEAREGGEAAAALYAERGRQSFLPLSVLRRVMDEIRPDLVVATNSPRAERAALEVAGERGTPAVCVVDLFGLDEVEWVGRPGYADRVCVISESVRQMFLSAGRTPDEVVVTGNPAFDPLGSSDLQERGLHLRRSRCWGDDFVILFAAQPEPASHPKSNRAGDVNLPHNILHILRDVVESEVGWRLVVRPHPSQALLVVPEGSKVEASAPDEDLASVLRAVDVVVTLTSTVGLEAVIIGTPVVSPQVSILNWSAPYVEQGIALGTESLAGLRKALRTVAAGNWRPSGNVAGGGRATANVVGVIESLLAGTPAAIHSNGL